MKKGFFVVFVVFAGQASSLSNIDRLEACPTDAIIFGTTD